MKRKVMLMMMLVTAAVVWASGDSLSWKETKLDLGQIQINESVDLTFTFTNNSSESVLIAEAKGSCGCTQVKYPREPVAPGTKAEITGKFKTSKVGAFNKTIKVRTSLTEDYVILSFRGEAVE